MGCGYNGRVLPNSRRVARSLERLTLESFQETSFHGLQRLVDGQVPEGTQLDYKVDAYQPKPGSPKDPRDELRKDVSALANANGGVLILGVADQDGLPTKVVGLKGSLEKLEGHVRQTLASRVEPFLDGVEILPVLDPSDPSAGCLLVLVPPSTRKPHAVRPIADDEALKYARRAGRHTTWLSEAQVAHLYRDRFIEVRSQHSRLDDVLSQAEQALDRHGWLIVALVPDDPGDFTVDRGAGDLIENWWIQRDRLDLIPNIPWVGVDRAEIGPRQIILAGHNAMRVPVGWRCAFHGDGSAAVARELEQASRANPAFFLDHLVGAVLEALEAAVDFSVGLAGGGGLAGCYTRLHFPEANGLPIHAYYPSWTESPQRLPGEPPGASTTNVVDLDSASTTASELVAASGIIAGHLMQHFGEADARYLAPDGAVRIQQFGGRERDHHVRPKAMERGLRIDNRVGL